MNRFDRTLLSLALMLVGPPLVLLLCAHLLRPAWPGSGWIALVAVCLSGLAGLVSAPWSNRVKAAVAAGYFLIGIFVLPILGVLAACAAGDCL